MNYWEQLDRQVQAVLRSGRIGRPVFVRCTLATLPGGPDPETLLLVAVDSARRWFDAPLSSLYCPAASQPQALTLTASFASGATALISVGPAPPAGPGADLLLVGNHGTVYHDGLAAPAGQLPQPGVPLPAGRNHLLQALRQAIQSATPVHVKEP